MYCTISARSTNAESEMKTWKRLSAQFRGVFKQRTDRLGKIARGHYKNVLLVFEFV